jgi:hypothetical protein
MLTRIEISNYRGFKDYRMEQLARLNLLVGKNNSGKTALLESIHFLASGGDPSVLSGAASRRGEIVFAGREEPAFLDISHFFHGHDISLGSQFTLRSDNDLPPVTVEAVSLGEVEPTPELFEHSRSFRPAFALKITGALGKKSKGPFFLSEEGALLVDPRRPIRRYLGEERREGPPIVFIAPDSIAPESLGGMWNQVLRDKQESRKPMFDGRCKFLSKGWKTSFSRPVSSCFGITQTEREYWSALLVIAAAFLSAAWVTACAGCLRFRSR